MISDPNVSIVIHAQGDVEVFRGPSDHATKTVQGVYSRRQRIVASSSDDSEISGAGSVVNEAHCFCGICAGLGFPFLVNSKLNITAVIAITRWRRTGEFITLVLGIFICKCSSETEQCLASNK